jgi:SAM-dependent methyltransferase
MTEPQSPASALPDFTTVTERPDGRATRDQLSIMYTRYKWASGFAAGRTVLEVACGAGMGLGLLANSASSVIAGDIDAGNCEVARRTYQGDPRIKIRQFAAERIPYPGASFDLAILLEALYYIPDADSFFTEARRVLRPGGLLLISTVNCRWPGFNPSPFHARYLDADELRTSLIRHGFQVTMLAGFQDAGGPLGTIIGGVRWLAIALHLIPKTMRGKQTLKRLFYGRLAPIPPSLQDGAAVYAPPVALPDGNHIRAYKFIYAVAAIP